MARGFGGTALRAALGAVTGVAEGMRLREEREFERKKTEEAARQAQQMSMANLMLQGFDRPESVLQRQQGARQAAGSAIASALQAASGQTPTPITGDLKALGEGYAMARPDRTVTIGGQTLTLRETAPEREQRLAQTKTMQEAQAFENAVAQLPAELQPIARASKVIPATLLQPRQDGMTEYQQRIVNLRERELGMRAQERARSQATSAAPIPANERRSMTELTASIAELDKALKAAQDNPKAFGIKTILPNIALGRTEGVKPRADVTGAIVKLRRTEFGTAMSKQEKESGQSLFPAGGDDAETVIDKLTALREKAQLELDSKRSFYETASAQPATPAAQQLEQEFPDKAAQIQRARASGYTDAQIRARLIGGR